MRITVLMATLCLAATTRTPGLVMPTLSFVSEVLNFRFHAQKILGVAVSISTVPVVHRDAVRGGPLIRVDRVD
jgi:hypothetical protein